MKDFLLGLIEPLILWLGYADRETFNQILAVYDRRILALGDEIAAKDREIRDLLDGVARRLGYMSHRRLRQLLAVYERQFADLTDELLATKRQVHDLNREAATLSRDRDQLITATAALNDQLKYARDLLRGIKALAAMDT